MKFRKCKTLLTKLIAGIMRNMSGLTEHEKVSDKTIKTPCTPKFEPVKTKEEKAGPVALVK